MAPMQPFQVIQKEPQEWCPCYPKADGSLSANFRLYVARWHSDRGLAPGQISQHFKNGLVQRVARFGWCGGGNSLSDLN
jgi:hypothetical protein